MMFSRIPFQTILGVLGNLLDRRHNSGWSGSLPPGAVGEQFMWVLHDLVALVAKSLRFHVHRGDVVPPSSDQTVRANVRNIGKLHKRQPTQRFLPNILG